MYLNVNVAFFPFKYIFLGASEIILSTSRLIGFSHLMASLTLLEGHLIHYSSLWLESLYVVSHLYCIVMDLVIFSTCSRFCSYKLCICVDCLLDVGDSSSISPFSFLCSIFFSIHSLLFSLCCLCAGLLLGSSLYSVSMLVCCSALSGYLA